MSESSLNYDKPAFIVNLKRFAQALTSWSATWLLLHLAIIAILGDRHDDLPRILGRYSLSYAGLLASILAMGVIGALLIARPNLIRFSGWIDALRTRGLFRLGLMVVGILGLVAIWATPFQIEVSSVQRELIRGYSSFAVMALVYYVAFWRTRDQVLPWSMWLTVGIGMGALALIVTVHYLDRYPQLNEIDELHNWVVQWTFARTGLLGDILYRQMIPIPQPIYDGSQYIFGTILRFIGDTFWQARFARLLMVVLSLPFIYLCGLRMYGRRTALFAVVIALFIVAPTAYVRPDAFVGFMLAIALYLYTRAQTTRRPWMHYLTGFCIALAGEGHPLAYRFGFVFTLIYGVRWLYEMVQRRKIFIDGRIFALMMGGLTGALIYLSIHVIPGFDQAIHFARNYTPVTRTAQTQWELGTLTLVEQFELWVSTSPVEFVLLILGIVVAVRELKHGDRLLLTLLLVSEVMMVLTYGYYRPFYQVHFLPVFALLAGRFLANVTDLKNTRLSGGPLSTLALASMILVVMLTIFVRSAQGQEDDTFRTEFSTIAKQLKQDLPQDAVIVGNENYFLEMQDFNYYGIETVTTDNWFMVQYSGYKLWQVTNPDIFILSGTMDTPKYTDLDSIYSYMRDNDFQLARCYTGGGSIIARVYVRKMPPGWTVSLESCTPHSVKP